MTLESLRRHCLSFPDTTEQIQWGKDLVFKIGGKMFCVACTEPVEPPKVAMSFKCDDETFAALVEREGAMPAPYMAKHKWVALEQFDTLPDAELRTLIARAYDIVTAKAVKPVKTRKSAKAATPRKAVKAKKKAAVKKPARRAVRVSAPKPARRSTPAPGRRGR